MVMAMVGESSKPDTQFWMDFLNNRAVELGLEKLVKVVQPRDQVGVMSWVYEQGDGRLIDLGWNVEQAEATLRDLANAII